MKSIEKKMSNEMSKATGVNVTAEYVFISKNNAYFFIEWEGNDAKVKNTISRLFKGKAENYDYDSEFNFSSCTVNI